MSAEAAPTQVPDTIVSDDETRPPAEWSDEEIVAHVVRHVATQGRQASDDYDDCAYRIPARPDVAEPMLACAIGCLIPERFSPSEMVGTVADLLGQSAQMRRWLGARHTIWHGKPVLRESRTRTHDRGELLAGLQDAHDWPSDGPGYLREFARLAAELCAHRGLPRPPVLDQLMRDTGVSGVAD